MIFLNILNLESIFVFMIKKNKKSGILSTFLILYFSLTIMDEGRTTFNPIRLSNYTFNINYFKEIFNENVLKKYICLNIFMLLSI